MPPLLIMHTPGPHPQERPTAMESRKLGCRVMGPKGHLQCRRCGFDPWFGKTPWRRKWQPTPVFLPGQSHGQRSPRGYSPRGRKESDTTEGQQARSYLQVARLKLHKGLPSHLEKCPLCALKAASANSLFGVRGHNQSLAQGSCRNGWIQVLASLASHPPCPCLAPWAVSC